MRRMATPGAELRGFSLQDVCAAATQASLGSYARVNVPAAHPMAAAAGLSMQNF